MSSAPVSINGMRKKRDSPEAMPKIGPKFFPGGCSGMLGACIRGGHPSCYFHTKPSTVSTICYMWDNLKLLNNKVGQQGKGYPTFINSSLYSHCPSGII